MATFRPDVGIEQHGSLAAAVATVNGGDSARISGSVKLTPAGRNIEADLLLFQRDDATAAVHGLWSAAIATPSSSRRNLQHAGTNR